MAIDSRQKRTSSFGDTSGELPAPDGTIGAADRAQLLWMYSGLLPVAANLILMNRGASGDAMMRGASADGWVRGGGRG